MRAELCQCAEGFLVVRVTHDDDVGIFRSDPQRVIKALILGDGGIVRRVGFRNHIAAETQHGVFMAATGAGGRLEEQGVKHLALQQIETGTQERFQHFGGTEKGKQLIAAEIIEESNIFPLHMGFGQYLANIERFELTIKCHNGYLL